MTFTAKPRWFERHRILTLILANIVILLVACLLLEIGLRFYISYNIGYYTAVKTSSKELEYPWGTVPINSLGYPDEEFNLNSEKKRVGYQGDSVNFGVGAGYGYRVSELLEKAYPQFEHWNCGHIGAALSSAAIQNNAAVAEKYGFSQMVHLFNLNDILPDVAMETSEASSYLPLQEFVWKYLDWLRGRSYLYNFIRTRIKNYLVLRGYEVTGYIAAELIPKKSIDVIKQTANRITRMNNIFKEMGIKYHVVVLPYEMQLSDDAAKTYKNMGIIWEDGFLEGSTQQLLKQYVGQDVHVIDARYAFIDPNSPHTAPAQIKVGQYFVFNRGDKMDWNHPIREGHKKIADYLIREKIFE